MLTRTQYRRIKAWIAALRSGEYKRAQNALRTKRGFCCLGVACDVAAKANPTIGRWEKDFWNEWSFLTGDGWRESRESAVLPPAVMNWFGFTSSHGPKFSRPVGKFHIDGMDLNDAGYKFDRIADEMEKWLKEQKVDWGHKSKVAA